MEYHFKPAPLRGLETFRITDDLLQQDGGWSLPFTQITHAAFLQHRMKGTVMRRFDLWQGDKRHSLSWSGPAGGWITDSEAFAFLDLCGAIAQQMDTAQPGFQITWGEYGRSRRTLFLIGLASLLGGVGIFAVALATGVSGARLISAAIPMGLLALIGGTMTLGYGPWRKPPQLNASGLPPVLESIATKARDAAKARG